MNKPNRDNEMCYSELLVRISGCIDFVAIILLALLIVAIAIMHLMLEHFG